MSDDQALNDLAVRTRQLEEHLVRSPEYVSRVSRKARWLAVVLGLACFFFVAEEIVYLDEPKPRSTFVMGSIDATLLVVLTSGVMLVRTHGCRHRLNRNWLSPEARKTLEALQRERTERSSPGAPAGRTT